MYFNSSQRTSKCGKNISDTLGCTLCATFLFLPYFDVICDLLLNRHTATWNLFAISINLLVVYRESVNLIGYITRRLSADSLQW